MEYMHNIVLYCIKSEITERECNVMELDRSNGKYA